MAKEKFFYYDFSPYLNGGVIIHLYWDALETYSSLTEHILPARLLGITYGEYLELCEKTLEANLQIEENGFVLPIFKFGPLVHQFVKLLNARMNLIMSYKREREGDLNVKT